MLLDLDMSRGQVRQGSAFSVLLHKNFESISALKVLAVENFDKGIKADKGLPVPIPNQNSTRV